MSLAQFLTGIFLANKDTKNVGKSTVIAAIANLIINLALVKFIGIYAASISTLISYIVMFIGRFLKLKDLFDYKEIIKSIIKYNILFLLLSMFINYENLIVNITLLLITIILFILSNIELEKIIVKKIFGRIRE